MSQSSGQRAHPIPVIEEIRITPVAFRDPPLLAASGMHEPWTARTIIEVICEDGTTGLSETYGDTATIEELRAAAPALRGMRITDLSGVKKRIVAVAESLNTLAHQSSVVSPRTEPALRVPRLYAAFEVGCLDAFARHLGVPLYEVLGGAWRKEIPFAAYLFFKPDGHPGLDLDDPWGEVLTPDQLVGLAGRMIDGYGFRSLKLKSGVLDPDLELDAMEALARAYPDHPLRFDPNGNWTLETTLARLGRMEGLLDYLEDPVLGLEAMAQVQAQTSLPLATNMCVTGFRDIREAVARKSVQIVLADHHFWGGLQATTALDTLCASLGMGLSMHSNSHLGVSLMTMAHVTAACPHLTHDCDTHYNWVDSDVVTGGKIAFHQGAVHLTDAPGNGVTLDHDALARMNADFETHGTPHRDDTIFMRRMWPEWDSRRPRF
ncbi:enolase C-terminal domain-like protein [Oceaniglobus trochenteri]|uniref:enolase C-terminal domain-like protein n=1 Tax=Oceaniglobus trochenteri TaxID=2763260 RepID=UPI001CFFD49B|nr:enolase C-terminal domain-like protein [Oceaniglobus trochenteri]